MKTCLSVWTLLKPNYAPPYCDVISTAADCGFDAVDLPICYADALDDYWTDEMIRKTRALAADRGVAIAQVCMFQNLIGGLGSCDPARVEDALGMLRRGCVLARGLGAQMLNIISPSPDDISVLTTATLPEYYYLNIPDMIVPGTQIRNVDGWRFDAKFRMNIAKEFDWQKHWDMFVSAMRRASTIAAESSLNLTLENRNNTMTPHTDSMTRLLRHVGASNLGATFNVSQAFLHREILEWAAHKYGKNVLHVRACDADGLACYNLPIGEGIIDWSDLIDGLSEVGYDGYISLEWLNDAQAFEHVQESLAYLKKRMMRSGVAC